MKTIAISALLTVSILLAGCGKKAASPPGSDAPTAVAVGEPVVALWQQGNKAAAIVAFVETDWSSRPLFAASSPLSLSEEQFKALPEAERQTKSGEVMAQVDSLKKMAGAVAEAGLEAASKGDPAQARKYFVALHKCGAALDTPDSLSLLQLVGRAMKTKSDSELTKIEP